MSGPGRAGLWRYSRHPNYFFEWLAGVAFWLFAWPSPGGWVTICCPDYQHTTSPFAPWFPKA